MARTKTPTTTQPPRRTIMMRLACFHCDREDGDPISMEAIPGLHIAGWTGIAEAETSGIESIWWTHLGTCPDCQPRVEPEPELVVLPIRG